MPTDVKGYKQAVDSLSASISECVGPDLLSESADVVVVARELEEKMKAKLRETIDRTEQMLRRAQARMDKHATFYVYIHTSTCQYLNVRTHVEFM